MQNFIKLAEIDVSPLLKAVTERNLWHSDDYLRSYPQGPFGETDSIILRFPPRTVHETEAALKDHLVHFDQHENIWLEVANQLPEAGELVYWLAHGVKATRIGRVMINRIKPGGRIFRHADTPVHANYWERYHIVLHALPGNDFHAGDEMVNMTTGEVWCFDNRQEHEVFNHTTEDRIHMVVDLKCAGFKGTQ